MDDSSALKLRSSTTEIAGREAPRLDIGSESGISDEAECEFAGDEQGDNECFEPQADDGNEWGGCPHVDRNDARCGHRFSIGRLDQAFNVCFGSYHACPLYQRINDEVALDVDADASDRRPRTLVEIRVLAGSRAVVALGRAIARGNPLDRGLGRVQRLRQTGS